MPPVRGSLTYQDYLDHLAGDSARFARAVRRAAPGTQVPTCPDWDTDDLMWHLTSVQWGWATVVRERRTARPTEEERPRRPADRAALHAFFDTVSAELVAALSATPPEEQVWTWAHEHTVGFVGRRQAHEALIHRLDAELAVGTRTPMDPLLSADGVDEALRIMWADVPVWAAFTAIGSGEVRVSTTDTGDTWVVAPGRWTGVDPDVGSGHGGGGGDGVDQPGLRVTVPDPGADVAATVMGAAADLDCWLWGRPTVGSLDRSGDPAVLAAVESVLEYGI